MAGRRSENPRQDAVAVLQMHREGRHEEALARAADLAINNRSSAVACNLAGDLNLKAYFRNRQRNPELALKHANSAVEHYNHAMNASPNCIETIAAFGEALSASKQHDRAAAKFRRAKAISSPADPANQHAAFDTRGLSTKKERIAKAKDRLQRAVDIHTNASCEEEVLKVLDIMATQGPDAAARAVVNFGDCFPLSARAQLLRAHVTLQLSNSLGPEIDRRWILSSALHIISKAALTFKNSLVIALSHGEVLAILRQYDAAEKECYRALRIDKPRDPVGHDIPPGSVGGEEYADRVCFVKEQIHALLKRVVLAAVHDFSLMTREQQEDILSLRVDTLYEHFKGIDPSLADSMLDAQLFIKRKLKWDFWICPYPTCANPKFCTSRALWVHLSTSFEHKEDFQKSFHSVLDNAESCGNESKGPSSFDVISLSGDSHQQETFCFTQLHDLFDQMVLRPSGATEILPTAEMRRKIQREGAEVVESIEEYLRTSADLFSNEGLLGILEMFRKMLERCTFDYREIILPLARLHQWEVLKRCLVQEATVSGRKIVAADIDAIVVRSSVPHFVEHGSMPSETLVNEINDPQTTDVEDNAMKLSTGLVNLEVQTKVQSEEITGTSSHHQIRFDSLKNGNADEDLSTVHVIIRSLWNLDKLREIFLMRASQSDLHEYSPISEVLNEIFSSWDKNEHQMSTATATLLRSVKAALCELVNDSNMFQKLQVGKNFASETVAHILNGLHMLNSDDFSNCVCPIHNLFAIKFKVQTSCKCSKCFDEKEYTTFIQKLEVGSPQTSKIKSFAELPVVLDESLLCLKNCEHCGSMKNIDLFVSNTSYLFTIVLDWLDHGQSQAILPELFQGIESVIDSSFFCNNVHFTKTYTLASMIVYVDGYYICCVHQNKKWLVYGTESAKVFDSFDHILDNYKHSRIQPEVLFFESTQESGDQSVPKSCVDPTLYKPPPDPPRPAHQQAVLYGHGALHRPVGSEDSAADTSESDEYNPYADKLKHDAYRMALREILPKHEMCAICFFENRKPPHILRGSLMVHCQKLHKSIGIRCIVCSTRFLTDSDLRDHMKYFHGQQ